MPTYTYIRTYIHTLSLPHTCTNHPHPVLPVCTVTRVKPRTLLSNTLPRCLFSRETTTLFPVLRITASAFSPRWTDGRATERATDPQWACHVHLPPRVYVYLSICVNMHTPSQKKKTSGYSITLLHYRLPCSAIPFLAPPPRPSTRSRSIYPFLYLTTFPKPSIFPSYPNPKSRANPSPKKGRRLQRH